MRYIAALDYDHMDNGVFLTSIGRSLANQEEIQSIIVHGESEYTERLIQTGMMRKEARLRCIKDLNHRLVALFADQGVSAIGINGYQKKSILLENGELTLDKHFFNQLPPQPVLLLSSLVLDAESGEPVPVELDRLLVCLHEILETDEIFLFSTDDHELQETKTPDSKNQIPKEFKNAEFPARLTTPEAFGNLPDLQGSIRLVDLK